MADQFAELSSKLTPGQIAMVAATAFGAVSVFPDMPAVISDLYDESANSYAEHMKYAALFVLILQGGAGFQPDVALAGTVGFYAMKQALDAMFPMGLKSMPSQIASAVEPAPAPAEPAPEPQASNAEAFGRF